VLSQRRLDDFRLQLCGNVIGFLSVDLPIPPAYGLLKGFDLQPPGKLEWPARAL
jgi:hypothetical protein